MSTREEISEELLLEEETVQQNEIVLFNDEVNTFDHVINTLMSVCEHSPEQAEQCSLIVHYKGKCTVRVLIRMVCCIFCYNFVDKVEINRRV